MKISRRNFLKGGTLLVACLVAGLKPKVPKWCGVPTFRRDVSVMFDGDFLEAVPHDPGQIARAFRMPPYSRDEVLYGSMAGGGKTPDPFDELIAMLNDMPPQNFAGGGFYVSPDQLKQLLLVTEDTHV